MYSKQYLESQLGVALGGRLAEEIIFGEDFVTTGASNDIQQVANIAKKMVKEWGMSDKVGLIMVDDRPAYAGGTAWGNKVLGNVESEVDRLVHLARTLVEQEVVSAEEFQMMLVEFNAKTVDYSVIGQERNREKLPFQDMPAVM